MSISNHLGTANRVWTKNLSFFCVIFLAVLFPGHLIVNYLKYFAQIPETGVGWLEFVIEILLEPVFIGGIIFALPKIIQDSPISYEECLKKGFSDWRKVFGNNFVAGIHIALWCIPFIIPGIVLSLRYALLNYAVVLERLDGSEARQRSTDLTKENLSSIFMFSLVFYGAILFAWRGIDSLLWPLPTFSFLISVLSEFLFGVLGVYPLIVLFLFYQHQCIVEKYQQESPVQSEAKE